MPLTKQNTARYPRTWVFDAMGHATLGPVTVAIAQASTTVAAVLPITTGVKVIKVGVSWLTATLANLPTFNIVYNTVQNLGAAQAYTAGNIVPNDNSYTAGVTATTPGANINTTGFPNPALTTAFPNFQQIGGLGIPTNVAVDGQPLFAADVVLNTTNFPGANATNGGQGILIPTNYDAVYPAGVYPYGVAQGLPNAANLSACFTLRATSPTTTVTGLTVTLFLEPVMLYEAKNPAATLVIPGVTF